MEESWTSPDCRTPSSEHHASNSHSGRGESAVERVVDVGIKTRWRGSRKSTRVVAQFFPGNFVASGTPGGDARTLGKVQEACVGADAGFGRVGYRCPCHGQAGPDVRPTC